MKKALVILIGLLISTQVYAAENKKVLENAVTTDSAVSSIRVSEVETIYTKSISTRESLTGEDLGVMYKADAGGVIKIRFFMESGYDKPETEGSYSLNYITSDTVDSLITDNYWHIATIDSVVTPYVRFKLQGASGNSKGAKIQIKVIK